MFSAVGAGRSRRTAICRITDGRDRWRVVVESWPEQEGWRGRLLFVEETGGSGAERETRPLLAGQTHEDLVSDAHELEEDQLRRLLNSL